MSLNSYIIEIAERKIKPLKLAFELSNSKLLAWIEINDDDEQSEKELILSAAKINHEFSKYGFHISSTIVEKEDCLIIPTHYIPVSLNKNK